MLQNFLTNTKGQFVTIFGSCIVLTAVSAVIAGNSTPNYSVTLRLAHARTAGSLSDLTAYKFKELLEQNSNGQMTVTIYPANGATAGEQMRSIELLQNGTIDLQIANASSLYTVDPRFEAFGIPYLFENEEQVKYFINNQEVKDTIASWLDKGGLKFIAMSSEGGRQISNNVKEIRTPADLANILVRAKAAPVSSLSYATLGAQPVELDAAGVGRAIEKGTIQAQDSTIATYLSSKLYQTQPFVTKWDATYDTKIWVGNNVSLSQLTPEQQQAILKSASEAVAWGNNLADNFNSLYTSTLADKGVTLTELTDEEIAAFKAALYPVFSKYYDMLGASTFQFFLTHRGEEGVVPQEAGELPPQLAQMPEQTPAQALELAQAQVAQDLNTTVAVPAEQVADATQDMATPSTDLAQEQVQAPANGVVPGFENANASQVVPGFESTPAPVTTEQVAQAPITTEQVAQAPVTTEQVAQAPATTEQVAQAPVTTEQVAQAPVTTEQVAQAPVTTEQVAQAPVATEQVAQAPVATEQAPTEEVIANVETTDDAAVEAFEAQQNQQANNGFIPDVNAVIDAIKLVEAKKTEAQVAQKEQNTTTNRVQGFDKRASMPSDAIYDHMPYYRDQPQVAGFNPILEDRAKVEGFAPIQVDSTKVLGFAPVYYSPRMVAGFAPADNQNAQAPKATAIPPQPQIQAPVQYVQVPIQGQIVEVAPGQYVQLIPVQQLAPMQAVPVQAVPVAPVAPVTNK